MMCGGRESGTDGLPLQDESNDDKAVEDERGRVHAADESVIWAILAVPTRPFVNRGSAVHRSKLARLAKRSHSVCSCIARGGTHSRVRHSSLYFLPFADQV